MKARQKPKKTPVADQSTEQKIREAAQKVFTTKGFAATRTRDIAEEAGLNLALLNYYFRSKKKLFDLIMIEKMQIFFGFIGPIIYNETSSLDSKIEGIVSQYTEMLQANPDLPFFVLGESRNNPDLVANAMPRRDFLKNSVFIRQLKEKKPGQDPYQFLLSLLGMTIFPFLMKPVFQKITEVDELKFRNMMTERKRLLAGWCKAILRVK